MKKYLKYIVVLFICMMVSDCQLFQCLFYDLIITEPEDGFVTNAREITVSGCGSDDEINELKLLVNNVFVELKDVSRGFADKYFLFNFFSVPIPSGNSDIEVRGYSKWPVGEIASDYVSILCDRIPPTIVITSPANDEIIYSDSVTFVGSISDNDEVRSFRYYGEYGHRGNISIENGKWSVAVDNLPYEYQYITFIAEDRVENVKLERIYFTCAE